MTFNKQYYKLDNTKFINFLEYTIMVVVFTIVFILL
jgi:hypothetical protein